MPDTPEARARQNIDRLLTDAGWIVQSRDETNITAGRGVAIREFPMKSGYGEADYLLYVDAVPAGVVEAKKEGETLTSHEIQTEKYSVGLPDQLKPYRKPLPFCYQSTGVETRFTNLMEPDARSRPVFSFHRPETLAEWVMQEVKNPGSKPFLLTLPRGSDMSASEPFLVSEQPNDKRSRLSSRSKGPSAELYDLCATNRQSRIAAVPGTAILRSVATKPFQRPFLRNHTSIRSLGITSPKI